MLSLQNIEAELSYAYLHAVATRNGFACEYASRHLDDAGVDAVVREDGRKLLPTSLFTSFDVHIQLKATFQTPIEQGGFYSYSLSVPRYDKLRSPHLRSPRLLIVLYLPSEQSDWLTHSEEQLISKRCAYWVSLRNAPPSANPKHQTVYIPRSQRLSVESLRLLMERFSCGEEINYEM